MDPFEKGFHGKWFRQKRHDASRAGRQILAGGDATNQKTLLLDSGVVGFEDGVY